MALKLSLFTSQPPKLPSFALQQKSTLRSPKFFMASTLSSASKEVENPKKPFTPPREVHVQVTHSMPPQKIEIFKSMENWAEQNILVHLKPVEKCWQPQDFLPDPASDGFHDQVKELRERAKEIPDDYFVALVGDMITEEALPTYQTMLNTLDGVRDETGASPTSWGIWTRAWTAEENRHGDLLNKYLYLTGRVDMRQIEKTIQYLIGSGMDPRTENSPYLGFIYTSFQERATFISHGNTARHAKEHGDSKLAQICGTIAADEKRHETAYTKIVEKLFEIDPDGTVMAFADMMRKKISMPAHLMYDGRDDNLFEHFSAVAQRLGVYTARDYADILEFLVGRWNVEKMTGLSAEGRKAQDYVCTMALRSAPRRAAKPKPKTSDLTSELFRNPKVPFALALIFADAILVALIIAYVPYTKIDWDAYMSQVSGFVGGERDYSNLKGDTGPLVYPAGFLYVYSAIQYVTGGEVYPAQILFGLLYIINLGIVLFIYMKTDALPWWALSLLCLSKRMHSIFVLRLFNDCFATTLLHAAMASLLYQRWHLGLIIFSGAVSIKMNVLLYAPSLFLLMLKGMDIIGVISALAGAALVQILLGLPFLISHPIAYISRAFNLGRVFIHFWSVNFKFIPEPLFVSKELAVSLLVAHLVLLAAFTHYRWCKHEGGLLNFLHSRFVSLKKSDSSGSSFKILNKEHIVTTMFVGNFIGIVCARSLHFQFYSWYFYSLPYLLWRTPFPTLLRIFLFIGVEICWNIYPSNAYSSALLLCLHLVILWGLWSVPSEYPYVDHKAHKEK